MFDPVAGWIVARAHSRLWHIFTLGIIQHIRRSPKPDVGQRLRVGGIASAANER
jgi:hypothetical protein